MIVAATIAAEFEDVVTCMSLIWWVLVWMIVFISSWLHTVLIITLKHRQYSAISLLHQLQFTVAHALGFSVSSSLSVTLKSSHSNELSSSLHFVTSNWELTANSCEHTFANSYSYWTELNWTELPSYKCWRLTCGRMQRCVLLCVTSRRSRDPSLLLRDPVFTA
jgi:hypothetical protein